MKVILLFNKIDSSENYVSSNPCVMPKMQYKFKGDNWDYQVARDQLQKYMSILGFGHGGTRRYMNLQDKPLGWHESISFEKMKHPSYMKLDQINAIIESLLQHRNINPYEFYQEDVVHPKPKRRKNKKNKSQSFVEESEDEFVIDNIPENLDTELEHVSQVPAINADETSKSTEEGELLSEEENLDNTEVESNRVNQPEAILDMDELCPYEQLRLKNQIR